MGSIPLVANTIQTPTPRDPLQEYARVAGLKSQLQGQQIQQQEIQQNQQAQADRQAATKAMLDWDGKSYETLANSILQNGGSANAAQGALKQGLSIKDTASQIAQRDADTGSKQIDTILKKHDAALGAIQGAEQVPDAELGQHILQTSQQLAQSGMLEPELAQQAQKISQLPPDQARQSLKLFEKNLVGSKEQFEQAQKTATQKIEQQKADQGEWKEAGQGTLVNTRTGALIHGVAPVDQQELQDYLKKHPSKGPADFAAWKASLSPQAQINVQAAGGGPGSDLAAKVASGDLKIGDVLTYRTPIPIRKQFLQQVLSINPDFKSYDYDIEKGVSKDFTSGPDAQKLQAFNTAITHMGIFKQAAAALDNGDEKTLSRVGNALSVEFGGDKVGNFNIAKKAFVGEVSRAFDGAGVTQGDRRDVDEQINAASSPRALLGAAETAEKLLRGKRDVLKQQYDAGKNAKPNFGDAGGGGMVTMRAPNGMTKQVPSDQVEHYKSLGATTVTQ